MYHPHGVIGHGIDPIVKKSGPRGKETLSVTCMPLDAVSLIGCSRHLMMLEKYHNIAIIVNVESIPRAFDSSSTL